jgi:hypothetical protein
MKFGFKSTARNAAMALAALLAVTIGMSGTSHATSKTYSSIQKSKWTSCTVCAGAGGNGKTATYSQTTYVSSPSMSGASSKFSIGGSNPYAAALWWKQLGPNDGAHHFVYDLYFYMKNPSASQALEFDVNQSLNGRKFIFGTQCDIKGSKTWDVWAAGKGWLNTSIPCSAPTAYKWHHVILEFQRTTDNKVKFVSVTYDGKKSYFNRTYSPKSSSAHELNAAFQMDGDKNMTDYQTWLDKVTLKVW